MTIDCGVFKGSHKPDERVVLVEMNVDDLVAFRETFPANDLYRDELNEMIEAVEPETGD